MNNNDKLNDGALAEHLFSRIAHMGHNDVSGLTVWRQTQNSFNGNLIFSAPRLSGGINILLADFSGQGLSVAVAAMPVAAIFYEMTAKGFGLSEIIAEINKKLVFVLPQGFSCSVCFVELDRDGKMLAIWNGGLADVIVVSADLEISHRVISSQRSLGEGELTKEDLESAFIDVTAGDKVFLCSTAIRSYSANKINKRKNEFESLLCSGIPLAEIAETMLNHVDTPGELTLVELDLASIQLSDNSTIADNSLISLSPENWQADFTFSAQIIKRSDIIPLLVNVLMQLQAPYEHKQRIYTVLAEMYSNALEHGLLKLSSSIKNSATGFTEYYSLRSQRLAALEQGYIKISLHHQAVDLGGLLTISVEDSGDGFDYKAYLQDLAKNQKLHGRGEALLAKLCKEYSFKGRGNIAQAVYQWAM